MAVAFDAVGPSSAGQGATGASTLTWTHTVAAGPATILVGCSVDSASPDAGVTCTCTCDGVAMASLGRVESGAGGTSGFLMVWAIHGIATGARTILVTPSAAPGDLEGGSVSFTGAGTTLTPVTGQGTSTTASAAVTADAANMIAGFMAAGNTIASSANTSRFIINQRGAGGHATGNAAGSTAAGTGSAVSMSWTLTSGPWAVLAVEVGPPVPPPAVPADRAPPLAAPGWHPGRGLPALPRGTPFYRSPLNTGRTWFAQTITGAANLAAAATVTAAPAKPFITGLSGGTFGHFVDQYGHPRLFYNDLPFGLPANAGRWNGGDWQADFNAYFAARAAQGFTTALIHPWGHSHTGCNNDVGNTWDGVSPWTTIPTLNNTFWTRIDGMFAAAAANGITVLLGLTMACDLGVDAGFAGTGVWNGVSAANMQTAAQNIATRYASTNNLLWFFGDDYNNNDNTRMNAVIAGIRAAGDTRPASIEYYSSGTTSRRDTSGAPSGTPFPWGDANAGFNFCYSYWVTYFPVEFAYQETTSIPPVWGDGYFSTRASTQPTDKHIMRNMVWWALASGARGVSMGSETLVPWSATSLSDVTSQLWYTESALAVYTAFTSLAGWENLLPDLNSTLVTAGRGTRSGYASTQFLGANLGTQDYVAASITPDHSLAVIYCAVAMSITIDQSQLGAGYTATWIDPWNGTTQPAAPGSTYASAGLGSNGAGDADWVLVLQGPPVAAPAGVPQLPARRIRPPRAPAARATFT